MKVYTSNMIVMVWNCLHTGWLYSSSCGCQSGQLWDSENAAVINTPTWCECTSKRKCIHNNKNKCSMCTIGKDNVLFITGCTDVCYRNFLPLNRAANLENHLHFYLYRILQWTRSPCNDVNCMCLQLSTGPLLCAHEASWKRVFHCCGILVGE